METKKVVGLNLIKFNGDKKSEDEVPTISATVECGKQAVAEEKKKSGKFSTKQKVALIMLGAADFMSFCSMSIMAPFFPQEAYTKGMTESMAGFVFGFYALVVFLSSPIFGKVLPKLGVKFVFIVGLLISGVCSFFFGTLNRVNDYTLFTTLSFIIRGCGALGTAAYSTAAYVIIINIFPDNAGAVRGLIETFVGLGMSAGPGLGGLLFAVGGFGLPFYVIGVTIVVIAPLNLYLLPPTEKSDVCSKTGSLTNMLKLSPVIMTCLLMVVVAMTWGFLDPTLEPHLRKFHLSAGNIGLIFLLLSATYGLCCPIWGWLTDKTKNYWWLMPTGLFCNSFVLLFLGPSPLLTFLEDSIWLNIVSLSALGVFVSMSLMPTYQFILDSSLESGFVENIGTHSVIAGLWSSVFSLGEVLGPILGGTLMEHFGFPVTATVFSALNLIMAICGLTFFLRRKASTSSLSPTKEEEVRIECYNNELSELTTIESETVSKNGHVQMESVKTK